MIKILNRIRMLRVGNRIKKSINSEFIKNKLSEIWKVSHNFRIIGDIIGDCVLYNILFKRNGNKDFFNIFIDDLYKIYLNDNYNEDEKNIKKAEIIGKTISKHLNLSITENNSKKIKKYFLKEYNKHGYVYHSFPSVYFEGISKSGLQAKNGNKSDNSTYNEIEEIQKTFVSHGIYTALGGAGIYGGSGIYYSHKEGQIYPHAIFGPERFSRFTSSDHHTITSGIENIPFAFRNKKKCRENIYKLCKNAGLDNNETKQVINFFERIYKKLSKNGSYFALIPKTKVGKIDYNFPKYLGYIPISKEDSKYTHSEYKELINSIRYTLGDWGNNYKEHIGNIFYANIKPTEMFIIKLPEIGEIIKEKIEFKSETKEHLLDEQKNKETIEKIKTIKKEAPNRIPEWIFNSVNNNKI